MRFDWKKVAVLFAIIAAAGLMVFLIYFFFFRSTTITPIQNQTATSTGQLSPITDETIKRIIASDLAGLVTNTKNLISEQPTTTSTPDNVARGSLTKTTALTNNAALYTTKGTNGVIYYNAAKNRFEQVDANGNITVFNNKLFYNVSNVTWSNNSNKAILEYPDGSKIIYDFTQNKQVTVPKHWEEFSFSPNDQNIAFKSIALDVENRFLAVSKSDGSETKAIEAIGGVENNVQVNWSPNNQMVATVSEGLGVDRSNIYFVGLNEENFKLMVVEGRDFQGQWSPDGDLMLYSVYDPQENYKPQLWISKASANEIGNNRQRLNLETWSDKCVFANNTQVICAASKELPNGAGLAPEIDQEIADNLYSIDLQSGSKKILAIPDNNIDITNLIVSDDGNYLFFNSTADNKLYKINLK